MILDRIKTMQFAKIDDINELRKALEILVDAVEVLSQRNDEQAKRVQEQADELAKLKGGNARPVFKNKKKASKNISSGGKEKGLGSVNKIEQKPFREVPIDRSERVPLSKVGLPADIQFKGYETYTQQELVMRTDNVQYLLEVYYSPSEQKTYKAALPACAGKGHFGSGIKSFINVLYHYGNVTTKTMEGLLKGIGLQISAGSINNILRAEHDWAVEEQSSILQAGLSVNKTLQMDCTGNVQKGKNKTTHILTGPLFSVFYTLASKSRIACLNALQGNPKDGLKLMWHKDMEASFREAKVSKVDSKKVMELLTSHGATVLSMDELDALLKDRAPDIFNKNRIGTILKEVMALCYYDYQQDFPRLERLVSDDAPEYGKIATHHALCWVHDARYFNKLSPVLDYSQQIKEDFMGSYWAFYQRLLDYKSLTAKQQKKQKPFIIKAFDALFQPATKYGALDMCIERTRANKQKLLMVLDFPFLPLHNNDSELGARKVVRKRDISLHTWTDWGTELRDAFLTITETARKIGVPIYKYIHDRISGNYKQTSLADRIRLTPI
ncbi:IS66 family transposase [Arachidicoccus soli]|uniref:Transposase IS66 central domain-containing protein n=1 Tax=Arachidicoccus soli TaxID=2341117 RepID=A0A386HL43_9BACT|nr:transposase [Arachidicoccus soli]AYD46463.1 hypothetical protein D6B99_01830 [Arachidicoccus soli]